MKIEDPLVSAVSAGAEFRKCALQVNPHHYSGTFRGQTAKFDEQRYSNELIRKAVENDVSVLAVTDHNHVGGIDPIRTAARSHGIYVFPGFELKSREGVHVLCLYPLETTTGRLNRYLGGFGVTATEPSSALCDKSFSEILAQVAESGGISIGAHVTSKGGLLNVLEGEPRIQAWKDKNLFAVQIPGMVDDLPQGLKLIVKNKDQVYKRQFAPEPDRAIAVVNASDVTEPNDLSKPEATCWIKMSEVGIEGLRQAFLDPGSRIRLNHEATDLAHSEISAIAWHGGFLNGASVRLHPNLNVLVGGRGAGKSTFLESLRIAFGLDSLGSDARENSEGIRERVLRNGTKISLLVKSRRPDSRAYRIERTIPRPAVVRNAISGERLDVSPKNIFPGVEVYGQHEISELAKSPEMLTDLLRRFLANKDEIDNRKDVLRRELEKSKRQIVETSQERLKSEERMAELSSIESMLKRYEDAGLEQDLKEKSQIVSEEHKLAAVSDRVEPFRVGVDKLQEELPIDRAFLSEQSLKKFPGKANLRDADKILEQLNSELKRHFIAIKESINNADIGIQAIQMDFESRKSQIQNDYEEKLRYLQKSQIDGEEFIRLRHKIESLEPIRRRMKFLDRMSAELAERRRNLLAEWEEVKDEEVKTLTRVGDDITGKLKGRVRVQVESGRNRESLFSILQADVRGRLYEAIQALRGAESLDPKKFVTVCRRGAEALVKKYGIPKGQALRLAQAQEETLMSIECLDLPLTTRVELNTAVEGTKVQWQSLNQLSTGQRATAVLLLLLLESDSPLVVDQPEDDLDNRFITDGIVPLIRREKRRRQLIFSTHNANIPVLGDAELIVGLSASGDAKSGSAEIAPKHQGSIDAVPVKELVGELLEGGEAAFERRRRKYGF